MIISSPPSSIILCCAIFCDVGSTFPHCWWPPRHIDAIGSIGSRTREFRMSGRLWIGACSAKLLEQGMSIPPNSFKKYDLQIR